MGFFQDFKDFAVKGNAVDLAVGVIIGAAFGKIVASLVNDVIMPPIGLALGGIDFTSFFIDLSGKGYLTLAEAKAAGAPVIAYGNFINVAIEFIIIALVVFVMVRQISKMKRKEEKKEEAQETKEQKLLTEIRDALVKKKK